MTERFGLLLPLLNRDLLFASHRLVPRIEVGGLVVEIHPRWLQ
jgi:hypothetical protein